LTHTNNAFKAFSTLEHAIKTKWRNLFWLGRVLRVDNIIEPIYKDIEIFAAERPFWHRRCENFKPGLKET